MINLEEIVSIPGIKILEINKKYIEVELGGNRLFISNNCPINRTMNTDFYQLLNIYVYFMTGKNNHMCTYDCFYRRNPFNSGYGIFMGLQPFIEYLKEFQFTGRDIDYIKSQYLFSDEFLQYLRYEFNFSGGELFSLPEGSMIQPYLPVIKIRAKAPIANFIETNLLNTIGYQTMVATKATRITNTSLMKPWFDFLLRRAPGMEAALWASRAAWAGGCDCSSNVLAGQQFGIPNGGSQSHSCVMMEQGDQVKAFENQFEIFGENGAALLDTYSVELGINDCVRAAKNKNIKRIRMVRTDGDNDKKKEEVDLIKKVLENNGFKNTNILISNSLDEYEIDILESEDCKHSSIGIGEKLIENMNSGFVYKLSSVDSIPVIKICTPEKTTDPGDKNIWRLYNKKSGEYEFDLLTLEDIDFHVGSAFYNRNTLEADRKGRFRDNVYKFEYLYNQYFTFGLKENNEYEKLNDIRTRVKSELNKISPSLKNIRSNSSYSYPVYLSKNLAELKRNMISKYK